MDKYHKQDYHPKGMLEEVKETLFSSQGYAGTRQEESYTGIKEAYVF